MRDKNSTMQHSAVEQIAELPLVIISKDRISRLATPVATEFNVRIHFSYTPGFEGKLVGRWEDAEEPVAPQVELVAIRLEADTHFDSEEGYAATVKRGTDIREAFTHVQLDQLADKMLARVAAGSVE